MNNALVQIDHKEYGLEKVQAENIEKAFMPKIAEREGLKEIYSQIIKQEITPGLTEHAKSVRLKLVNVRTGLAKIHKTQKAFFRAAGLYVDAWKNKETLPVTQMEEKLFEIEDYYLKIERERLDEVERKRTAKLEKYEVDSEHYDLRNMPDAGFNQILTASRVAYELRASEEKAAGKLRLKQEKDEADQNERNRIENERLKKEAADTEVILEDARGARDRLQTEMDEKTDTEETEKKAQKKAQRTANAAPDRVKLEQLAISITSMEMPQVNSDEAKAVITNVVKLLNKTSNFIKEKSITI